MIKVDIYISQGNFSGQNIITVDTTLLTVDSTLYTVDITGNEYLKLDLFDDEKISVTSSIQNINDISKTYTDFSQTFTVPASKQNNKIFRHWYDNSNDAPFSTLTKSNAYIEIDTIPFRKGKIQLESANIVNGKPKDYSITFIGLLGNLKDKFAGLYLKDLDKNRVYDFEYNGDTVKEKVAYPFLDYDVMFPLISSKRYWKYGGGGADDISVIANGIRFSELFPAITLRAVFNMIETQFGITLNGFIDAFSDRFYNAYLYLKNSDDFSFKPTYDIITFQNTSGLTNSGTSPINLFKVPPLVSNLIYTNNLSSNPTFSWQDTYKRYVRITIIPTTAGRIYTVNIYQNNVLISSQQKTSIIGTQVFNTIAVNRNSNIRFEITSNNTMTFNASVLLTSSTPNGTVTQELSKTVGTTQTVFIPKLAVKDYFPEMKIEDFFSGVLKMFNLTCFTDDGVNYLLETLDDYYAGGSDIEISKYVIQDKKNLNRVKTYRKINFDYEKSESIINTSFFSKNNVEYGSLNYANNPPTDGEDYAIKLPFENLNFQNLTPLLTAPNNEFQVGYCLKPDLTRYIPKPMIIYAYTLASPKATPNYYFYTDLIGTVYAMDTYVAFGQETYDTNLGDFFSLNFNEQQSTLNNQPQPNGLYDTYYKNYFNNIFNYKARLIKVSAILPTSIITSLKLNDSVIIRDAKYLINTMNIDLTTGLVQFELLTDQRQ